MAQDKQSISSSVVTIPTPALDAFRRHLQDGSDYLGAYREQLSQSRKDLDDVVRRRAAESLQTKK